MSAGTESKLQKLEMAFASRDGGYFVLDSTDCDETQAICEQLNVTIPIPVARLLVMIPRGSTIVHIVTVDKRRGWRV